MANYIGESVDGQLTIVPPATLQLLRVEPFTATAGARLTVVRVTSPVFSGGFAGQDAPFLDGGRTSGCTLTTSTQPSGTFEWLQSWDASRGSIDFTGLALTVGAGVGLYFQSLSPTFDFSVFYSV